MDKGWLQGSKSGAGGGSLASAKTLYDSVLNEIRVHGSLYHRHIPLLLAVIDETAAVKVDDESSDEQVMQRLADGTVSDDDVLGKQCVYLVMELCKGGALMQETGDGGFARGGSAAAAAGATFQPDTAAWYILHVLRALAYLHARGIAHRDVKPSNVLLASHPFDLALLCDLGSCIDMQGSTRGDRVLRTRANLPAAALPCEVTGEECDWLEAAPAWRGGKPLRDTSALTPAFQPPECVSAPYEYDAYAADIWALGA